jgi:hypothetical protein
MNKAKLPVFCIMFLMMAAIVWAAPVPHTGLTNCYDVAGKVITCPSPGQPLYGQDANYIINQMSYTKLDSGGHPLPDSASAWSMVKDNVTGLIWEMKNNKDGEPDYTNPHDADNTYTWYDSNPATHGGRKGGLGEGKNTENFIKALNDAKYGGFKDWRLPTIKELIYIVNYSISSPGPINTDYFQNTALFSYWSSTTDAYSGGYISGYDACVLHFFYGVDSHIEKGSSNYVRAVSNGQPDASGDLAIGSFNFRDDVSIDNADASDNYIDNLDGTVTDTSTRLMWQKTASSDTMTWEKALAYCEGLKLGDYTDWRLPSFKELRSLADHSQYEPAINRTYFPNIISSFYWSSTTDAIYTYSASGVHFEYGYGHIYKKDSSYYVRAVRDGAGIIGGLPLANLAISPLSRTVTKDAGSSTFSVSNANTGAGAMPWTAAVTSGGDWLSISSGAIGTNAGAITCAYTAYTGTASRTGAIRVTAPGATGSPMDVTIVQGADTTACTATIDGNYSLNIPLISHLDPPSTPSYSANFAYKYDPAFPTMILFRLTNHAIQSEVFSCKAATLSNDFTIHIPDVLLPDGITRMWVDLAYNASLSTNGNVYIHVSNYGVVPK